MDRVNAAINEADEIRTLLFGGYRLGDMPMGRRGYKLYMVPYLIVHWWVRFGSLEFDDEDYFRARTNMTLYACVAVCLFVLGLAWLIFR